MPLTPKDITSFYNHDEALVQRIAHRPVKNPVLLVDPDPTWPQHFTRLKSLIQSVLGSKALAITHVGSTSIPNMPAKPVIDVDLTVEDILDEKSYVAPLESVGFLFLQRCPEWYEHRFFGCSAPPIAVNLHVWGPECPESTRHVIFKEWLLKAEGEREVYARVKREAARDARREGEDVMGYNLRKEGVVREIYERAFRDLGYL
jgi:GrpB-like predicted nucleotidyltransferase (UPF0157 family)